MLTALQRWFARPALAAAGWADVAHWAGERHYQFRAVREGHGFIVEGQLGGAPWRMEWGPSQRSYIEGNELRLRAELALPAKLQVLLLRRSLMEAMEKAVFDEYVEGVQTCIDTHTPPEMRWLVMFPKLSGSELRTLREGYAAVTNFKPWALQWLGADLALAVLRAPLEPAQPLVLMIGRSRLSLRTPLAHPDLAMLQGWTALFEAAVVQACKVDAERLDPGHSTVQPSMWDASGQPETKAPAAATRR